LFERTLTVGSLSKTYAITGWRLGFVLAVPELISQARKVHDFLTVGAPHPLQQAAVTALRFPPEYYQKLTHDYTRRRELFTSYLRKAGLRFVEPQGAYYVRMTRRFVTGWRERLELPPCQALVSLPNR
jgi:aminotransferase